MKINLLKQASLIFLTLGISSMVWASGAVRMTGSIIETACSIDVGSRDQTISMGSLPLSQIRRDGQGPAYPFGIRLVNCVLKRQNSSKPNWQYFRVTFDGIHEKNLFSISGQAKGVGLRIQDVYGEIALPGINLSPKTITGESQYLSYQLRLVANHSPLVSGQFYSQLRFKLDYE